MQLPGVLESSRLVQGRQHLRRAALRLAVVQDRHSRRKGGERRRIRRVQSAMMRDKIEIGRPNHVHWTRERKQRFAGQIADVQKREPPVLQSNPGRPRVFRWLLCSRRRRAAGRIRCTAAI